MIMGLLRKLDEGSFRVLYGPLKDSITVPVRGLGFDVWDLGLT